MSLEVKVDQRSVAGTVDYMERVKLRIFQGVREAMTEGMEILAGDLVSAMHAAGIQNRTGALERNILSSPRVTEDQYEIRGRVKAMALVKAKGGELYFNNLGNILDQGFHDKAVKSSVYQFTEPGAGTFFARGHAAFDVKPRPFFRQARAAADSPLLDLIRARLADAADDSGI